MTQRKPVIVVAIFLVLVVPTVVWGHGGGIDGQGGHHDRKRGGYHFHQGPLAGKSYASKSAATRALDEYYARKRKPAASSVAETDASKVIKRASTAKKLDALIALLVKKGLIKEVELAAAIAGAK